MKKLMQVVKSNKIFAFFTAALSCFVLGVSVFAEGLTYTDVVTEVTNVLDSDALIGVLKYAAGAAVILVLLWWSVRKAISIIKRAFMRGKLRL